MDIHQPSDWIEGFLENVPEKHRESMGQMQALREYRDCISSLPELEQDRLWTAFQEALDERFPSRKLPALDAPEEPRSLPAKVGDEQIFEGVPHLFSAPGDQSPEFHEMLFNRAMGQVERELQEENGLSRWLRRRKIARQIRRWMKANLG